MFELAWQTVRRQPGRYVAAMGAVAAAVMMVFVAGGLYIGLLGMYLLLRSMDLRPPAAWFGALSFGLGGIYLSYVNLLPILFCAAWLPLTCLFVRRFLLRRNLRDFAAAALFLGIQFLVSEPTTVMQSTDPFVLRELLVAHWVGAYSLP